MGQSPEMWACKCLRTKHFHGVSSGNQHPYLLKSRYGKVRILENDGDIQMPGPAAAVQRPALTAQGWRGWGSPRWRRRMGSREKWLYISYTLRSTRMTGYTSWGYVPRLGHSG